MSEAKEKKEEKKEEFAFKEPDYNVFHEVGLGIWTYVVPYSIFGLVKVDNRAVIYHIPAKEAGGEGSLAVVNPSDCVEAVYKGLEALEKKLNSPVRYLISPGDWHYLFLGKYLARFPKATAYIPAGRIPAKKPQFKYTLLDDENPLPELRPNLHIRIPRGISDDISRKKGKGSKRRELVVFHPASRSITSGDNMYYYNEIGFPLKMSGLEAKKLKFMFKNWAVVEDVDALLEDYEAIAKDWDFDRYISIHGGPGSMIPTGAKDQYRAMLEMFKKPPKDYRPPKKADEKKDEPKKDEPKKDAPKKEEPKKEEPKKEEKKEGKKKEEEDGGDDGGDGGDDGAKPVAAALAAASAGDGDGGGGGGGDDGDDD